MDTTAHGRDLLPEGLEDRLTPASAAASRVTRAVMDVLAGHGYDRVQPPMIEFEKSLVARMDVATRRMFRFVDPASLGTLALRADITPQIGRIAATRLARAPRPLRLAYAGQVLTITGDGLNPTRERLQAGAELIGSDSVAAACEVVAMAVEALAAAGAANIAVDFTLPDLVDTLAARAVPLAPGHIAPVRAALDAKDAGGLVAAGGAAFLPLLEAIGPFGSAVAQLAKFDAFGALAERIAALRAIAARLGDAARLTLDPTERHGFEYQSWFGFTLYAEGARGDKPIMLGRGGTYAILGKEGADGEPATGFSLYPDALIDALAREEAPCNAVFLPLGHDVATAARLRRDGWRTIAGLSDGDDARALGCTHILQGDAPTAL